MLGTRTASTSSLKFRLGIDCGESLEGCLPLATELSRKAFLRASEQMGGCKTLDDLGADAPLTGLVLLYGPKGSMSPHYDSPTQPGQRQEWLAMMTVGNPVDFCLQRPSADAAIRRGTCDGFDSRAARCQGHSPYKRRNRSGQEHNDRAILESDKRGFCKIFCGEGTDKILGSTIVAVRAGEMINEVGPAMKHGIGLDEISTTGEAVIAVNFEKPSFQRHPEILRLSTSRVS